MRRLRSYLLLAEGSVLDVEMLQFEGCEDHLCRGNVVAVGAKVDDGHPLLLKQSEHRLSLVIGGVVPHDHRV